MPTTPFVLTDILEGPFEHHRVDDTWWWVRPDGSEMGYNRVHILLRCQRIWGGHVKVIRQVTNRTTTAYRVQG